MSARNLTADQAKALDAMVKKCIENTRKMLEADYNRYLQQYNSADAALVAFNKEYPQ